MKSLENMTNLEKGKLLANLYPNEIQGILNSIESTFKMLFENKEDFERNWDYPLISFGPWIRLAELCNEVIIKNKRKLLVGNYFATKLFNGYISLFTIDCILKYAEEKKDTRFWHLVQALFRFEK